MKISFGGSSRPPDLPAGPPRAGSIRNLPPDSLVQIAEEVWRLGRRVDRVSRTVGEEPLKGLRDSLTRLEDTLCGISVRIEDHVGQPYDEGLRLDVMHVEGDSSEDQRLWIIETIRPTVSFAGKVMNRGQVILGDHPPEVKQT